MSDKRKSTLGEQAAAAQAEVAKWPESKRASVRLEGGSDFRCGAPIATYTPPKLEQDWG